MLVDDIGSTNWSVFLYALLSFSCMSFKFFVRWWRQHVSPTRVAHDSPFEYKYKKRVKLRFQYFVTGIGQNTRTRKRLLFVVYNDEEEEWSVYPYYFVGVLLGVVVTTSNDAGTYVQKWNAVSKLQLTASKCGSSISLLWFSFPPSQRRHFTVLWKS